MKVFKYIFLFLSSIVIMSACSDDETNDAPGNPVINSKTEFNNALFGDSLAFTIEASDAQIPLSTLKVKLYFGEEIVSEKVIRTKTNGNYSGKIYVPFYKNIPNGNATLEFALQNTSLTIVKKTYDIAVSRPDYPYLTLVAGDKEYRMERKALNQYAANANFPMKVAGYIKAPIVGSNGNEITFGWQDKAVIQGSKTNIPFSNTLSGQYDISFNTLNYEASPFLIGYAINNQTFERIDENNYRAELNLQQGKEVKIEGIDNLSDWWIDPDFLTKDADGKLTFVPSDGKYRINANFELQYFQVEAMSGSALASLQADGTGAIWVIGDNVGKPSLETKYVGWNPDNALCLLPIGGKKYQITLVAGKSVKAEEINFKFFYQKNWGGEFTNAQLSTTSDLIFVGNKTNGRDPGNLGIVTGKTLEKNASYVFTIDLSAGNDKAVLTVVKK